MKDRILHTAAELFCQYGIRNISMEDIARQLGISKKTIYLHFTDKDSIVTETIALQFSLKQQDLEQICSQSKDPISELMTHFDEINLHLGSIHPTLLNELKKYHPVAWDIYYQYKNEYLANKLKTNLITGIQAGVYRSDLNVDIITKLRIKQLEILLDKDLFPYPKYRSDEVSQQLQHLFIRGLLTVNGLAIYEQYLRQHHDNL